MVTAAEPSALGPRQRVRYEADVPLVGLRRTGTACASEIQPGSYVFVL